MALNMFHNILRPTQLLDQHFGMGLHSEDLLAPLTVPNIHHVARGPVARNLPKYYRPWKLQTEDVGSTLQQDEKHFHVNLDVKQFAPEELNVKVVDNSLVIEGKHEEKQDDHGYISRQFQRRYVLPEGHDLFRAETKLSSDGVLKVSVPKVDKAEPTETVIPIVHTGQPHKAIERKQTREVGKK